MLLTKVLIDSVSNLLAQYCGGRNILREIKSVSGGSINQCYKAEFQGKSFFIKINSAACFPGMFEAEASGLQNIAQVDPMLVPQVIGLGQTSNDQFLVLEWIDQGIDNRDAQRSLGRKLAQLHSLKNSAFGLDHDNYMGSLIQHNNIHLRWADFFISQRLIPQVNLGVEKGLITGVIIRDFETLYKKLEGWCSNEVPSLIHGDLWGGNYLIDSKQQPVLIDPAVSFGNKEVDIAMTKLFGGFQNDFYDAYNEALPLNPGWNERLDLWNLYPLLIHLNLFGTSYLRQITQILYRYV